ncbi:DUF6384 family protein [Rhizobiaceae bacterium BDR2-2]|uniref:DUF6384 family protein n=1 Tax=Ectorhizobium quercum TaxID=2965071 RepID=A0AAE3MYG3_9HYPH|nr:DUF6384 family protein [Ectorhizobium quercum]MCX8997279.1 DUF6384 family protein [Ectorhizobium quercum]
MSESTAATPPAPALDELMLAMDVVDTLRHQESVAVRELAQDGRDETLKERLRRIYESQGLEVSDRILDEGIKALKESRFTYEPTPPGLPRTLAGLWVRRASYGKAFGALALVAVLWGGWSVWQDIRAGQAEEAARIELAETLPAQIVAAAKAVQAEARTPDARERLTELQTDAVTALERSDAGAARAAVAGLERLRGQLVQTYELRIVSRQGEQSGVYRIPDVNTGARNYYLIVEAVTPEGRVLSMPIINEENGRTETVSRWGVRVPEQTYEAVRRDKVDDGILQNAVLATKPRGALVPVYSMTVSGGAITQW